MELELPRAFKSACKNLGQDLVDAIGEKPENEAIARLVNTALIGLDRQTQGKSADLSTSCFL